MHSNCEGAHSSFAWIGDEALLTLSSCASRPGGLKKDPPSEVGNLVTSKEDTLFGLPTQRGKDISRDTVRSASLIPHPKGEPNAD